MRSNNFDYLKDVTVEQHAEMRAASGAKEGLGSRAAPRQPNKSAARYETAADRMVEAMRRARGI